MFGFSRAPEKKSHGALIAAGLVGMLLSIPDNAAAVVGGVQPFSFVEFSPDVQSAEQATRSPNCLDPAIVDGLVAQLQQLMRQVAAEAVKGNDPQVQVSRGYLLELIARLERKKCPPQRVVIPVFSNGVFVGLRIIKIDGDVVSTETLAGTDQVTNRFSDRKDPLGVGVIVGYKFTPANNIGVSPFVSFDWPNISVNHNFPNGSFLGAKSNFAMTAGVKVGPQLPMGLWLYGIGGVSILNETLNINFIPLASSKSTTVAGATAGFGGAIQPTFLQGFGLPVSLFAEYQHTWWQSAQFNTPAASPFFNYNFRREDDTIKFGFLVSLGASAPPPAAPPSTYPVKEPRLK